MSEIKGLKKRERESERKGQLGIFLIKNIAFLRFILEFIKNIVKCAYVHNIK